MGLLSHRVERSELKPGDHIYTWRAAYSYSHHGIYVGGSKVVHFTTKKEAGTAGLDSARCHPHLPRLLPPRRRLHGFEYGVPPAVFLAKLRGGTCTTAASDPADAVVHRAMYLLQNGFGSYDVFENNCEDFALYCKTGLLLPPEQGIGRSGQAASAVGVPLAALFSTPFRLMSAGPLGMAAVTAGMYCAGRYITDIGVRKDVVKVEVENLSAHLGWRRAKAEEVLVKKKQQPGKVTRLLPLKRKRDSDLHLQSVK
ncbi:hypothetical protein ZWY2020_034436 [Hordeum vulgare]|nr:hypothetical protein ZWY2020_034436 [Hordeum vulgare]